MQGRPTALKSHKAVTLYIELLDFKGAFTEGRDREGTAVPRGGRGAAALGAAEAAGGGTVGPRAAGRGRRAGALLRGAASAVAAPGRPGGRDCVLKHFDSKILLCPHSDLILYIRTDICI